MFSLDSLKTLVGVVVIVGLIALMVLASRERQWGVFLAQLVAAAVVFCLVFFPQWFLNVLTTGAPWPAPV